MATVTGGDTNTLSLEIGHEESITQGDFVQIEQTPFVAQVTYLETAGGVYAADATFVGRYPDQAVPEGATVSPADSDAVLSALDIPEDGLHVGDIRGLDTSYTVDADLAMRKQLGVFGRTGSGKSYTTAVLIEELLDAGKPVVVVDPHGEYASLKVGSDGDPAPFPVTHYAPTEYVPEADRDLDPDAMAPGDLVKPGHATVLDLVGLGDRRDEVVTQLLSTLFEARKRGELPPAKVVVEEAHSFAAKQKTPPRSIINSIAKEGRKFQFTLAVVSQRPSDVFHEVRSNLQSLLIHKLTDDTDVDKAITVAEGIDRGWETQIQQLESGHCIVAGDLVRSPLFVDVRSRHTMHHADSDGGAFTPSEFDLDPEAIAEQQSDLEETVAEATTEQLREQVKRLARRRGVEADALGTSDESPIDGSVNDGVADTSDVPPENAADRAASGESSAEADQLRSEVERLESELDRAREQLDSRESRIQELEGEIADRDARIDDLQARLETAGDDAGGESRDRGTGEGRQRHADTGGRSGAAATADVSTAEGESADEPAREREEVLSRPHIQAALERYRSRLHSLSAREQELLRVFARRGYASPEYALNQLSLSGDEEQPSVERLAESGFVEPQRDGTYTYAITERLDRAVGDTLRDGELEYVVAELEKEI